MQAILDSIEPYYILLLVVVGFIGNSLSFLIFAFTKLRFKQVHVILAVLAVVDNAFLLVLFLTTFMDLMNSYQFACQCFVFLPFLFGFLSIWLIVLFSIERFVVVYFPLKRYHMCNLRRNFASIVALVLFAVAFYSYGFWTSHLGEERGMCMTRTKWLPFVRIMTLFDMILTMLVPFVLILVLNALIVLKLARFHHRYCRPNSISVKQQSARTIRLFSYAAVNSGGHLAGGISTIVEHFRYSKTTRMLLITSTLFLVLHGPIAMLRIFLVSAQFILNNNSTTTSRNNQFNSSSSIVVDQQLFPTEQVLERITCYIYNLHYSLNFFLYVLNLKKFRQFFCVMRK